MATLTLWSPTSVRTLLTETMTDISQLEEADFDHVSSRLDEWWGGRSMSAMLPRLWFKHFSHTSLAARDHEGKIVGFLVGYIQGNDQTKAYVHFIGVEPKHRGMGLGRELHLGFQKVALSSGCTGVEAVTSSSNKNSLAFHEALGFVALEPDGTTVLPSAARGVRDYDGVGEDRVLLYLALAH